MQNNHYFCNVLKVSEKKYNIQIKPLTFCKYRLNVGGKVMELTFPQLLQLRQKLDKITTPHNLLNIIENENFVLFLVADKEYLLFLEIPQLLKLKEKVFSYFKCF